MSKIITDELVITKKDEVKAVVEEVKKEMAEELKITPVDESSNIQNENEEEVYIPKSDDEDVSEDIVEDVAEEKTEVIKEELKIAPVGVSEPPKKQVDHIAMMEQAIKDVGMESILTEEEESVVDGFIERSKVQKSTSAPSKESVTTVRKKEQEVEEEIKEKKGIVLEAESILNTFKGYITGAKFDKQCETAAKKHGVDKKIVKNKVVAGFLSTIANILGLTITIVGDVIMSAVNFIAFIINKILDFAVDNLLKLINLLTLNCGNVA